MMRFSGFIRLRRLSRRLQFPALSAVLGWRQPLARFSVLGLALKPGQAPDEAFERALDRLA